MPKLIGSSHFLHIAPYLHDQAESEEIEYNKPLIEFIRYYEDELTIIAEVLKQVGPEDYLINAYSAATGNHGEQGIADPSYLDVENAMERLTKTEFEIELEKLLIKQE